MFQIIKKAKEIGCLRHGIEEQIIGQDEPWPMRDVLNKLIEASEILLHEKDYDGHGWEQIVCAIEKAKEISEKLAEHGNEANLNPAL